MNSSDSLWQQIIEPIEDRMIRAVWRITRNAQDAEDAMQNALMTIWKRQHRISKHSRWFERAKHFRYYPVELQLGHTRYTCDSQNVVDPDGSRHQGITAIQKYVDNSKPGELFPADYVMRPEFVCRPPMGIGNPHQEPAIDLHPAGGPPGCILLIVAHTTKAGRVNEKGIGLADVNRFWLDPQRDYIAMRWEMVMLDGTGKETITSQHIVEETARSPRGVWYATRIRWKNAARDEHGKESDQIYHIYVDFDAELPDSLFEVPKPGRIE